jgi:hypothetical protein
LGWVIHGEEDSVAREPRKPANPLIAKPYRSNRERDHYAAVGRVAGEWAFLEFFLDYYTQQILQIDERAAVCLLSQVIGPGRKLDAYIAAVRLRGVSRENKTLETFATDTIRLGERRNRVVHDSWTLKATGSPARYEMTARRIVRQQLVSTPTADILKLSFMISAHIRRLRVIHERIFAWLAALPGTPPPDMPR